MDLHSLQRLVLRTCNENIYLNNELAKLYDELEQKDALIKSLRYQLAKVGWARDMEVNSRSSSCTSSITPSPEEDGVLFPEGEEEEEEEEKQDCFREEGEEEESSEALSETLYEEEEEDFSERPTNTLLLDPKMDKSDYFSVPAAVEEIQKWFFLKGGHLPSIKDFIAQYTNYLREIVDLPVDRVFIAGLMQNPKVSVYTWKWEDGEEITEYEIPREKWEKRRTVFKDAPFLRFCEGGAHRIRMKASENPDIPEDCKWFKERRYQDYYALPMHYQGEFVGAMSWSTKDQKGFSPKHLEFFARHLHALTAFLRLHTNDIILTTLANQLEEEVTERTAELAKANRRIMQQSAAQLKNFACMSHEIRTPLNCIIGLSSLLVDTKLDESQQESLRMIIRSGDLLLSVVNDVLDYSRLESGNIEVNFEPTDLRSVSDCVLQSMDPKIKARNISVVKSWSGVPPFMHTDGSRLQQILYNLLGNAVKFSRDNGTIEFTAQVWDVPQPKRTNSNTPDKVVRITVKDYGKGIAKGDLATIFEPFNQGTGRTARDYGGTGLGLAITANLVKRLKGTISVRSEEGQWAEFVVELPCVEVPPPSVIENSSAATTTTASEAVSSNDTSQIQLPETSCMERIKTSGTVVDRRLLGHSDSFETNSSSKIVPLDSTTSGTATQEEIKRPSTTSKFIAQQSRILVVDDNVVNRKVLVRMLDRMGANVIDTAADGLEACQLEEKNSYDLILMDMEMPVMDGLEACQRILSRPRLSIDPPPKVIFVTAHALDTFHAKAMAAGGSGFLTKPFHLKKLTSIFNSIDWHSGGQQEA